MAEEMTSRSWRFKKKTLIELEKMAKADRRKLNSYVAIVLEDHVATKLSAVATVKDFIRTGLGVKNKNKKK